MICTITTATRSCADCWHHCRHIILHDRHCSKTSFSIWNWRQSSHIKRVMKAVYWPTKQVIGGELYISSLCSYIVTLPQVKNQRLTALNKRRRLEWCLSMLELLGEAKWPHSWGLSNKTFISVSRPFWCWLRALSSVIFENCHRSSHFSWLFVPFQKCSSATSSDRKSPFFFPAARAGQSSQHEDHLGNRWFLNLAVVMTHLVSFIFHVSFNVLTMSVKSFFSLHFWLVFAMFSLQITSLSVCHPKIWLSRSTSKTNAPEYDLTRLWFTESQMTSARGVMVSDIMDVLDFAQTLHFVEYGLKFNSEEWIKVMDECSASNCEVLMESGCMSLWLSTRRRTLVSLLVTTARQCCTSQSSFRHRVPQIRLP